MKFGGSSVKDEAAIASVVEVVRSRLSRRPVVVVSALGGITDALIGIADALERGETGRARDAATALLERHRETIAGVIPAGAERDDAVAALNAVGARLARLIDGMECLGEVSARSRDAVLALGETAAAPILAAALCSRGLTARAVDPARVLITDGSHGAAVPRLEATRERLRESVAPLVAAGEIPVLAGFVGTAGSGATTTLGRGGSDLTASVVAACLGASELEYWKDVPGILTADPRLVPEARPVPVLCFREAAQLAWLGARVLHPASIQPAVEAGIPVRVLSTFRPGEPGTVIGEDRGDRQDRAGESRPERAVKSIACKRDQLLVNVHSTRMLGASGFLRRVFEVFDRLELSVDHIATSEVDVTVTLGATPLVGRLRTELGEVATVEVQDGVGVVSLVGRRLTDTAGVGARIFGALERFNIRLVTYGGAGVNLSLVLDDRDVPEAVASLHRRLVGGGPAAEDGDA
jgi:aspartate kinase